MIDRTLLESVSTAIKLQDLRNNLHAEASASTPKLVGDDPGFHHIARGTTSILAALR